MKKNGFISMSLIYSFFLIFLTLMTFLLTSYRNNRYLLNEYKIRIKERFINNQEIKMYLINNNEYEEIENIEDNYILVRSNCDNGNIIYNEQSKTFNISNSKAKCQAYFQIIDKDNIHLFYNNKEIHQIINKSYTYDCDKDNVVIDLDSFGLKISEDNILCNIYFTDLGDKNE